MLESAKNKANDLVERWSRGDDSALGKLSELCLTAFNHDVEEQTSREWISDLQTHGPSKLGFDVESGRSFLEWAIDRVKVFANDPHRKLVYAFYSGDAGAIDKLYRLTRSDLVQSLNKFRASLPDDETVDIVADFFSDLLEKARLGRCEYIAGRGTFLNWARTVVQRRAISLLRKSGRLSSLPEGNEPSVPSEFIVEASDDDGSFQKWIVSGLTSEQRAVFNLLVKGYEQQEIAAMTGFGSAKISKMLDEIRSRVADRMQTGGYSEALKYALDRVRSGKGMKGLLPRLFLRFVVPMLLDTLTGDETWAPTAHEAFGEVPRDFLRRVNPENDVVVEDVADKIVSLYSMIADSDHDHAFCVVARQVAVEPWGKQIECALKRSATQRFAAAGADSARIHSGRRNS